MSDVPLSLRNAVVKRAANRCEYCQLAQEGQEAAFHVDHVRPRAAQGATVLENLALACVSCSLRKGAKESACDPVTNKDYPLFNPRTQTWVDHFRWDDVEVIPVSPVGRATIAALDLNRRVILAIRREEVSRNRHPPKD